jgi:hypothetical protein
MTESFNPMSKKLLLMPDYFQQMNALFISEQTKLNGPPGFCCSEQESKHYQQNN